jgi:catechol 2,3-dioxygenase
MRRPRIGTVCAGVPQGAETQDAPATLRGEPAARGGVGEALGMGGIGRVMDSLAGGPRKSMTWPGPPMSKQACGPETASMTSDEKARPATGGARPMTGPQGAAKAVRPAPQAIDPQVRIGHVHLRTADIDRVRAFYVDLLGFDVIYEARGVPGRGTTGDVLFVSAGGYHHHLGFNTWMSRGGAPQPDGVTGLHHVALLFSSQAELARVVRRLLDAGIEPYQALDHGTHLAVYVTDPDGNDLELAWDRDPQRWPTYDGTEFIDTPMDVAALIAQA